MIAASNNTPSYQDYRFICKQTNINIFDHAINSNNLPYRLEHGWILLKVSAALPLSILGRVVACIYVISLNLIKIIIPVEFNQKEYLFIEIKNELLHLISCIAIQVLRIGSTLIGLLSPETAAKGWRVAERIDAYCWNIKAECQSRFLTLMDQSQETSQRTQEPHHLPIRLFSSHLYLGTQRVNTIARQQHVDFTTRQYNYSYTPLRGRDSSMLSFGPQYHQESIAW